MSTVKGIFTEFGYNIVRGRGDLSAGGKCDSVGAGEACDGAAGGGASAGGGD